MTTRAADSSATGIPAGQTKIDENITLGITLPTPATHPGTKYAGEGEWTYHRTSEAAGTKKSEAAGTKKKRGGP